MPACDQLSQIYPIHRRRESSSCLGRCKVGLLQCSERESDLHSPWAHLQWTLRGCRCDLRTRHLLLKDTQTPLRPLLHLPSEVSYSCQLTGLWCIWSLPPSQWCNRGSCRSSLITAFIPIFSRWMRRAFQAILGRDVDYSKRPSYEWGLPRSRNLDWRSMVSFELRCLVWRSSALDVSWTFIGKRLL